RSGDGDSPAGRRRRGAVRGSAAGGDAGPGGGVLRRPARARRRLDRAPPVVTGLLLASRRVYPGGLSRTNRSNSHNSPATFQASSAPRWCVPSIVTPNFANAASRPISRGSPKATANSVLTFRWLRPNG